jgi:aspartate beta-hydroxylase
VEENTAKDPAPLARAGFQALQQGDAGGARKLFLEATSSPAAGADAWFGLSRAQRALGAAADEEAALERTLALAPRHVPALIRRGDIYAARADTRAALSFFRAALKIAGGMRAPPAQWSADLERIGAVVRQSMQSLERHLLADLERSGHGIGTGRSAHAIELLLGRRQIYFQQPKILYFPELPQVQFYDRNAFPWAAELERQTAAIRAELAALLQSGGRFAPYMQSRRDRPAFDNNGLLNDPAWSACHLIERGEEVPEMARLCPATLGALRKLPLCRIRGRTPTALFSRLLPGAHIPPHNGYLNTRLICHLPLIVPDGCALRVGNETRAWRAGELVIFDDSIEHEAWNRSAEPRVVLLFDIWRPELGDEERALVAATLESIDRFGGPREEWTQ